MYEQLISFVNIAFTGLIKSFINSWKYFDTENEYTQKVNLFIQNNFIVQLQSNVVLADIIVIGRYFYYILTSLFEVWTRLCLLLLLLLLLN